MTYNRLLALLATILFAVAFVLFLTDSTPDPKTVDLLLYGGLAAFAGAHV